MTQLQLQPMIRSTPQRGWIVRMKWQQQSPPPHEFLAALCAEEDGGFSAFALNFPGVVSQGETTDEAKANIAEAFLAMLEARRKHGEELAQCSLPLEVPVGCERVWIIVDG